MILILLDIGWFLVPFCVIIGTFFTTFLLVGLNQYDTLLLEAV
jgi:hypothetical protein